MKTTIFQAIRDKLANDFDLLEYLGGPNVYRTKAGRPGQAPAITLAENTESSSTRPGYRVSKVRDNGPVLQVDVWVNGDNDEFPCNGDNADTIANRIDDILLDATSPVTGTSGWEKTTASQQFESETRIWHNALRYSFRYSLVDA